MIVGGLASVALRVVWGRDFVFGLVPLFDMDDERSLPTFVSAAFLLGASFLLYLIATARGRAGQPATKWRGLAGIFLFLSIDEACSIHEHLVVPVRNALDTSGVLTFAWVIPYAALLSILGFVYLRFWFALPPRTRMQFAIAAFLYVGGAMGIEMLSGWHYSNQGRIVDSGYVWLTLCEESFELVGIAVFIHALLDYIAIHFEAVSVRIGRLPGTN